LAPPLLDVLARREDDLWRADGVQQLGREREEGRLSFELVVEEDTREDLQSVGDCLRS